MSKITHMTVSYCDIFFFLGFRMYLILLLFLLFNVTLLIYSCLWGDWNLIWRLSKTVYRLIIIGIGCDWCSGVFLLTLSLLSDTSFHSLELLFLESWFIAWFVTFSVVFTTLLTVLEFISSGNIWLIFLAELSSWKTLYSVCLHWTQHVHSVNPFTLFISMVSVSGTNSFTTLSAILLFFHQGSVSSTRTEVHTLYSCV